MEKKAVSGIILTLLLLSMSTLAFNIQRVKADWTWTETIYIRADGSVYPDTAPISSVDNVTYTLTDNIVGDVPQYSRAIVVERNNIVVDGAGYTLQGTGAKYSTGIFLRGRSNVTIKNMEIKAFGIGIDFYGEFFVGDSYGGPPSACSITGNNITANNFGIYHCGSNHRITGNNITNNNYIGVYIYADSNNTVSGNTITNNGFGIGLAIFGYYSVKYNTISGNNITNNGCGISIGNYLGHTGTSYNTVSGNNITNNGCGIGLDWTHRNSISSNTISNNNRGIHLQYAGGNIFYHNNFINNKKQVDDDGWWSPVTPISKNTWDNGYPSGGNYWSDYTGTDTDGDGIGDDWYWLWWDVDPYNKDRYPLMKPYGGAHDIGITGITPSETLVGQGAMLDITITVLNYGLYTETFNLTAYANTTVISQTEVTLSSRNSATITFTWDTAGVTLGTYTLKAQASTVPGETDTTDNYFEDGVVTVVTPEYLTQKLIETIKSWNLPAGTENSLTSKLEETIHLLNMGNDNGAVHKLMDFMNQVEALRDKGKLENWQADYLIAEAQRIIDLING